ncbi:MAG TPA: hypothetical protein VMC02_12625, partial [Steroidobacteraceae bacterium]|nr:hypothetical protein [Steroidobacteraceae bacterium]
MPFGWTRYVLDRISGLQVRRGAEQSINDASRDRADFRQFYQDCGSEVACTGPRDYSQQGRKALQE